MYKSKPNLQIGPLQYTVAWKKIKGVLQWFSLSRNPLKQIKKKERENGPKSKK